MHLGSFFPNSLQARRVEVSVCFTFPQQLCVLFSEGQFKRDRSQSNAPGKKKKNRKIFLERPPLVLIEVYNIETRGRRAGVGVQLPRVIRLAERRSCITANHCSFNPGL